MIFSLKLSQEMDKEYYGKVEEEIYECTRQEELTDRLYCFGHIPEDKQNPVFQLFSSNNIMIWETSFDYPELDTP